MTLFEDAFLINIFHWENESKEFLNFQIFEIFFQNTLFEVIWSTYTHKYNVYKLLVMCILKMWEIFQKIT